MIWSTDELIIFFLGCVVLFIAIEVGFRLGFKHSRLADDTLSQHVGALQNALLGLLALLLGFTFSMSIARYDLRKDLVLQEANAISTAYLRSDFLPEKQKQISQDLLGEYIQARLGFFEAGLDKDLMIAAQKNAVNLQEKLWDNAVQSSQIVENKVLIDDYIQSLNDVIDLHEKRLAALENHVPETVILLLFFVSTMGMAFIGYSYGLSGKRRHGSTFMFALMLIAVLLVILDIDRPRRGLIQVSQASLERLSQDIGSPSSEQR
jgi:hypothetical protein